MIPKLIVIHYTASKRDTTTLEQVNDWHKARGFNKSSLGFYVGYHYLILGNGKLIQTRRENEIGCHCIPNEGKIGICLTGNENEMPSESQLSVLEHSLEQLKKEYGFDDKQIKAHRELCPTLCPGQNIMDWLNAYRQLSILQKLIEAIKQLLLKGRK